MLGQKDVLTTGQVAKICSVAPRTVSKWFDSGQLHGYRIPGSKDRRIPVSSLVKFMRQHHIPLDSLVSGGTRVLVVDGNAQEREELHAALQGGGQYEVKSVSSGFSAGIECERFKPNVILIDAHLTHTDCLEVLRQVRENQGLHATRVIAMSSRLTDGQANQLRSNGFDGFLRKPFSADHVARIIDEAVAA